MMGSVIGFRFGAPTFAVLFADMRMAPANLPELELT